LLIYYPEDYVPSSPRRTHNALHTYLNIM